MNVEFSQQANLYLDEYKNALVEQYGCSEERANELQQQMEGEIRAKAFNANGLPVCQYTKLGQKKDAKGNCLNQNLRFLQYMSKSTKSTWGASVICDMEHDIATVHRILHSSYITESSSKWILLKEFVNRNTMRNNIMKRLRNEGRFSDRSRALSNQKSQYQRLVEKYIPIIKSYLEDLKDIHEAAQHIDLRWVFLNIPCFNSVFKKEPKGLIGDKRNYDVTIAIDVLKGTIGVAHYKTYGSHWECDGKEYKLDDIKGISKDFYIKLYSNNGELIKYYAEEFIPQKISNAEKKLEELENWEP